MKISKQARRDAKQLFRACQIDGLLDEALVRQVVDELVSRKPRGYLPALTHLHRLVKLEMERRTARIESAAPVSPELEAEVRNSLTALYGAGLSVVFTQNSSLLGGLRIQVGSDVYDGTVKARLEALQEGF